MKELETDFNNYQANISKTHIMDEEYLKTFYEEKSQEKRYVRWVDKEISNWELNQIIGWIEFYVQASKIKANLWFINSRRIIKRPKNKVITLTDRLGEVVDTLDIESSKFLPAILKFVNKVRLGEYGHDLNKYFIPDNILLPSPMFIDCDALYKALKIS